MTVRVPGRDGPALGHPDPEPRAERPVDPRPAARGDRLGAAPLDDGRRPVVHDRRRDGTSRDHRRPRRADGADAAARRRRHRRRLADPRHRRPDEVDVTGFVLLAVAILVLLRAETRSREKPPRARCRARRRRRVAAAALASARSRSSSPSSATPLLPPPSGARGPGSGPGGGIDATLRAGRRSAPSPGSRSDSVRTDAVRPPYLRAATLSDSTARSGIPTGCGTVPLESDGLGEVTVDHDIRVTEFTTTHRDDDSDGLWLPVAVPGHRGHGLDGRMGGGALQPHRRQRRAAIESGPALRGPDRTSHGRRSSRCARSRRMSASTRDETTNLPGDLPPIISELPTEVTGSEPPTTTSSSPSSGGSAAATSSTRSRLRSRTGSTAAAGSSREVPRAARGILRALRLGVRPDGPHPEHAVARGRRAISPARRPARSVEAQPSTRCRAGSCTPGPRCTSRGSAGSRSSPPSASACRRRSRPLRAPRRIGRRGGRRPRRDSRAFEHRPHRGDEPAGLPRTGGGHRRPRPSTRARARRAARDPRCSSRFPPSPARCATASCGRGAPGRHRVGVDDGAGRRASTCASPCRRARRHARSRAGSSHDHGAPPTAMAALVGAIERASYAPTARATSGRPRWVTDAATAVRAALMAAVTPSRRVLAVLAPRSLIVRPGSVYAGTVPARARVR